MYGYQGYPGKVLHNGPRGTGGRIRKEAGAAGQRKGYPGSFRENESISSM